VVADSTFLINAVPFRSTNYINLYGTDITAIKRANEAIKQSEEKYRGIIESLKLGILEVDTNDKIIRAYPQFCSLIGYDEEELLGECPTELFLDESSKEMMRLSNNKRLDGHSSVYEISLMKKNGDIIWVIISGAPFYGSDGAVKGSIGVHLDITDRRKMESELRASKLRAEDLNKAEEMFLASMSHEIRTPMNAIIGLSELLGQTNLKNSQLNHLSAIQSSSKNLLILINDLLDFSKIESGKLTLESVSFDLRKLVLTAAETVSVKADENGVSIVTKIDKTLPKYLKGDPTRIGQVILNLLVNAVKFSSNASVRMRVDSIKSNGGNYAVKFVVTDEGIGISPDEMTKIFDAFSQANDSTNRMYGGTGLGLPISQKIVTLMDGELRVVSEVGKGSEFSFTIEMQEAEREASEEEFNDNYELNENFDEAIILLVEDNPVNSLMATTILEKWNCQVDLAVNGVEAIEMLSSKSYHLVLMDVTMPVMGGLEAVQIIRNELQIETPIVALTANAIKGDNQKCLDAGMNDYLSKPFYQVELNKRLTKWIEP
jgi:PAS domain S-box-containing protein